MKNRLISTLSLLAVLLASCAPAAVTQAPGVDQPSVQEPAALVAAEPSVTPLPDAASVPTDLVTESAPTETAAALLPIATSRGSDLQATDPGGVNLASGGLQFVEFFRYT